jgi:putative PIN family toxin of toxin-antitoxin system
MRVVADSNTYISALMFGGKPEQLLRLAQENEFQLVISEPILAELADVIKRKFPGSGERTSIGLSRIRATAQIVYPRIAISECSDPDDNRILEAAVEGNADFIVSGDKHLLIMNPFRGIEICTVNDFLPHLALTNLRP